MKLKGAVLIPPDTADTLRDCVQRTRRAFATVARLRERKVFSATNPAELLQSEAQLDAMLTELFYLAATIFDNE